jgi:RNA polymerase sigma-70 factor (ECF subfamily)
MAAAEGSARLGPPTSMQKPQQSCEATGQAIRARDPTALRRLVEDHLGPLFAFVFQRVDRDRVTAEEVVQETFLQAVRSAARFRGESTAWTWICGIARKLILGRRRRVKRRAVPFSDLLLDSDEEIAQALSRIEHEEIPERILERRETRRFVGAVMSTLPPRYQAGLLARYRDGKSLEQLARDANTTVKGAESLLHRARRAFADAFPIVAGNAIGGRR